MGRQARTRRSRHSSVGSRPIRPAARSVMLWPESTAQTPSVIGSSTPSRRERSRRIGAVVRPSTVWPISATACSGVRPCAISSPAWRLRPSRLQQRDDQVAHAGEPGERLGPRARRLAEPRHLGEAAGDQRRLRVVAEPQPVDAAGRERDHVLRRRAELDADEVRVDVDAEEVELIACCSCPASEPSSLAITAAVGRPAAISSAMFGPERTATGRPRTRVESRSPVAGSRPFVEAEHGASPGSAATTSAKARLGTATTTTSDVARGPRRARRPRRRAGRRPAGSAGSSPVSRDRLGLLARAAGERRRRGRGRAGRA